MKVKNKNKNLWSLCSPWDRRPTTNFGIWRIQCLPRCVNWHFLISLAKFFPSGSFLDASTGEPVALFFLQRRVTQSPWDRRPTTNFERWRIQSLPRFVNWHFLISLAKFFPSIARLSWTPMPDTYCSICHSTLWAVEMATLKMAVFFVSVHLTPLFFPHLHGSETQAARRVRRT